MKETRIEIRVGSDSDLPKIKDVFRVLDEIQIPYETRILSAHRTPDAMREAAGKLVSKGFKVSIGSAGGSAHLPGMSASETPLPVIALPVTTSFLSGVDSLYSMMQMPPGVPNGCIAIGDSINAAIFAAQTAYLKESDVRKKICDYRKIPFHDREIKEKVALVKTAKEKIPGDYEKAIKILESFGIDYEEFQWKDGLENEFIEKGFMCVIVVSEASSNPSAKIANSLDVPVISVPIAEKDFSYEDFEKIFSNSPLASMGVNRVSNGAIFASKIIGAHNPEILSKVSSYSKNLAEEVRRKDTLLLEKGVNEYLKIMESKNG